jgi:hypothetical protein
MSFLDKCVRLFTPTIEKMFEIERVIDRQKAKGYNNAGDW